MRPELEAIFNGDPPDQPRRPRFEILKELKALMTQHMEGEELAHHLRELEEVARRPLQTELPFVTLEAYG